MMTADEQYVPMKGQEKGPDGQLKKINSWFDEMEMET